MNAKWWKIKKSISQLPIRDIALRQKMLSYKIVCYEIKNLEHENLFVFDCQEQFKFFLNLALILVILHERKWSKWSQEAFVLKKALFSVIIPPATHFEQILNENEKKFSGRRQSVSESIKSLWFCIVFYSC